MPISPTASHAKGHGTILLSSIIWENSREDTPDLRLYIANELAPSIFSHGLIQPFLIRFDSNNVPHGVAGWCRAQALSVLAETTAPFNLADSITPIMAEMMRLEENIRRRGQPWFEIALQIDKIHKLKVANNDPTSKTWGQEQTGYLLGIPQSKVSTALLLASKLRAGDAELKSQPNAFKAQQLLLRRQNDSALKILSDRAEQKRSASILAPATSVSKSDTHDPLSGLLDDGPTPSGPMQGEKKIVDLSRVILKGDCLDWMENAAPQQFDLIFTDHPYGIDMETIDDIGDINMVKDAHGVESNIEDMPRFFNGAFKVLKDDCFMFCWLDLKHWNLIVGGWRLDKDGKAREYKGLAQKAGFTAQMWPIVVKKSSGAKNRAPGAWWTKNMEYIGVFRKGNASLKKPQVSSVLEANFFIEQKMKRNPFVKPFKTTKEMMEAVLRPGMRVLDPYAGSGNIIQGCEAFGCKIFGIEKYDKTYAELMFQMQNHYKTHYRNVEFV